MKKISSSVKIFLAIAVVVCYNTWVLWPLGGNPKALFGYLSELAARGQPYNWVFRLGDSLAAATILTIAVLGWVGWKTWLGKYRFFLSTSLVLVAIATWLDCMFPMPCQTTFDKACKSLENTEFFSPDFFLHTLSSFIVSTFLLASLLIVFLATGSKKILALGLAIALGLLGTGAISYTIGYGHGLIQVVQVLLTTCWFAYLACKLE